MNLKVKLFATMVDIKRIADTAASNIDTAIKNEEGIFKEAEKHINKKFEDAKLFIKEMKKEESQIERKARIRNAKQAAENTFINTVYTSSKIVGKVAKPFVKETSEFTKIIHDGFKNGLGE